MQKTVNDFIKKYSLETAPEIRYIDLVSEIGELGKEILKGNNYGKDNLNFTDNLESEIGDSLFSLLAMCNELDIDANTSLKKVIDKYENRFKEKGHVGSN